MTVLDQRCVTNREIQMKSSARALKLLIRVAAVIGCVQLAVSSVAVAGQPATAAQQPAGPAAQAPGRGRGPQPVDARVQIRTHHFAETNEDIPYALFVSSKVKKNTKAPLIVTLHGIGGTHTTMMRPNAIDLAEAGGYILLAPMGYNPRGWYGAPPPQGRRGTPPAATGGSARGSAPEGPAANAASPNAVAAAPPQGRRGALPAGLLSDPNDPPNLRELSEKETLDVIDLVRKEFKVDDDRTYLMGHSMGGAGTLYLAIKSPQRWAAVAALAPAAFAVDREGLGRIPKMPVMLVHGDMDTVVPVSVGRAWAEAMKSVPMKEYQYIEVPGGDHGTVIGSHQAEIFAFFARHSR
jgi:predicted esterase